MSRIDVMKLAQNDKVDERRAERLIREFGSYEAVMNASYKELLEVHYIGEETATSVYRKGRRENQPDLL